MPLSSLLPSASTAVGGWDSPRQGAGGMPMQMKYWKVMMQARKQQYLGGSDLGDGLPPVPGQEGNQPAGVNHGVEGYALVNHVS